MKGVDMQVLVHDLLAGVGGESEARQLLALLETASFKEGDQHSSNKHVIAFYKTIALGVLEKWSDLVALLRPDYCTRSSTELDKTLIIRLAYAHFKLGQYKLAAQVLSPWTSPSAEPGTLLSSTDTDAVSLLAQIYYRMGLYSSAATLYRDHICPTMKVEADTPEEWLTACQVNLLAAESQAHHQHVDEARVSEEEEEEEESFLVQASSHEILYNQAIKLTSKGLYTKALKTLYSAIDAFKAAQEDGDHSSQERQAEMNLINLHLAYVLFALGEMEAARAVTSEIISSSTVYQKISKKAEYVHIIASWNVSAKPISRKRVEKMTKRLHKQLVGEQRLACSINQVALTSVGSSGASIPEKRQSAKYRGMIERVLPKIGNESVAFELSQLEALLEEVKQTWIESPDQAVHQLIIKMQSLPARVQHLPILQSLIVGVSKGTSNFKDAVAYIKSLIVTQTPNVNILHESLGHLSLLQKDYPKAIEAYKHALNSTEGVVGHRPLERYNRMLAGYLAACCQTMDGNLPPDLTEKYRELHDSLSTQQKRKLLSTQKFKSMVKTKPTSSGTRKIKKPVKVTHESSSKTKRGATQA